ncbi:MAG: PPC domain-containing protein, partial [Anaerolineae bacterium]|nr:PPC domain-containing protein [Anaerolineae bacterium]
MADDELFENLDDFGDLDEEPSFGLVEDEFPLDLMEPEPEGLSRTFKIVGALMGLAVLAIIAVLVYFALGDQDKLAPNEKTSTAVAQLNQTIEAEYNATLTALAAIEAATQTAVFNAELTATAEFFVRQTEQALAATDAALTATAEFAANQTLAAAQAATQDALNQNLTATAEANRLVGIVIDEQGTIFGNVTLKLYRDDGDGVFTPEDRTPAPEQAPLSAAGLVYNEPVEGTLEAGQTVTWPFNGAAGDVVTIDAVAATEGLDLFVELVGPDGVLVAGDDDSGEGTNPRVASVTLPASGQYTVHVSSVAGAGGYTLTVASEGGSTARSSQSASGIVLVQAGAATPTPEISADELIAVITT